MTTLAQAFERSNGETLKGYVTLLGGKSMTRKGDRIDYLCRQMLSQDTLPGIWQFNFDVELTDWRQLYVGSNQMYGSLSFDDYWFIKRFRNRLKELGYLLG